MTLNEKIQAIAARCSLEDLLIQLAEEAAELTQAALKIVRANWGLTPKSRAAALDNLLEEIGDVENCLAVLFSGREDIEILCREIFPRMDAKMERWYERLEEKPGE